MKLYFSPGACSLASRISLHEAGLAAEFERVDPKTKITERGYDYLSINPMGFVPLLALDDGSTISENVAVLDFIVDREPALGPGGQLGRSQLLEILSWLSSELHVAFRPMWAPLEEPGKAAAKETVAKLLDIVSARINELYLFGPRFTVADAFLFAMLRWANAFGVRVSPEMHAYFERVAERPTVQRALAEEGLPDPRLRIDTSSFEALA
ncbi:glutathione binding-like protein [Sphingomonas pruni]|uniref:glutathione binding-like protein n=1 Tax=Sphingomonas pruni TaxID=40683 RepID=UPI00082B454E|nr:glutathione binding-like protein [Sphingomonas pruni]